MLKAAIKGEASKVTQAMLRWRTSQNLSWNGIIMTRDKTTLSARLLLPPGSSAYQLLYQVEARDNAGNLLARAGSDSQPLKLAVAAGPPRSVKPVWHRWWFWTVLGTVVVGGVTAGAVLLTNESAPQGNLQPGVVHLR